MKGNDSLKKTAMAVAYLAYAGVQANAKKVALPQL